MARTAGEADEPVVELLEQSLVERRIRRRLRLLSLRPRVRVRSGNQAAEVRITLLRLDEDGDVGVVGERQLRAGDRTDVEVLRGVGELE